MKSIKVTIAAFFIVSVSTNAHSQLWKIYADSANFFNGLKKTDKSIEYYSKAKEQLQKDSAGTASYAQINYDLANSYFSIRQYAKAEPLFLEVKNIREKIVGKEDSGYALTCNSLARLYYNAAKFEKAEPFWIEARQIREKVLGKKHPDYATSCNGLGVLYMTTGQFGKAEPLITEGKNIREAVLGKEHPDHTASCNNLAALYTHMGQYKKAELFYKDAKEIRAKTPGKEHADYATSCDNLGSLYNLTGQYREAEPLYIEAKNIREKLVGKESLDYATSCNNLGVLYWKMGQYAKAEHLYLESEKIKKNNPGKQHPEYAAICENLAALYSNMGQFEKAEPLFLQAKQINETALGKKHPAYASTCNNLAGLYTDMGQYEKAELIYLEAKQINKETVGDKHPAYAISCNNLGILYSIIGKHIKAERLFIEAMQIRESLWGKENPDYGFTCEQLANLYLYAGKYEKAEQFFLESKSIREKTHGKEHPYYATICNNLAGLYHYTARYEKAESLYQEAGKVREKTIGQEHPDYISTLNNLANLYSDMGLYEKAPAYYAKALLLQREQVQRIFQFTSEAEKQSYVKSISTLGENFLSFNVTAYSQANRGMAYDLCLFKRNLVLSSSQKLRNDIYDAADTTIRNKYDNWINLRQQISNWQTRPIAERPAYAGDLDAEANALEKDLTLLSSTFKKEKGQNWIDWRNIQKNLKPGEAAIEFTSFGYYKGKRWIDSTYYAALIIRKDKDEPGFIRLFEKRQLDKLLSSAGAPSLDNRINTLYTGNTSLYDLAWRPLEKYLKGITRIYFAAAGNLYKISLAAIPVNGKQVLGDKYQLVQLNTTATVANKSQTFITVSDKIELYGGVQYEVDSSTLRQAVSVSQTGVANSRFVPGDLTRGAGFHYLPGTLREVEAIKKQAGDKSGPIAILSGVNANEESIKALRGKASPSVLHIATHGFFFPDPKDDKKDSLQQNSESSGSAFKRSGNPLFRSGLLFAGANNTWQGKPVEGIEDGILTAYEVSDMYLPNTKLVVLSACETALGDIQGSEGVYGLQRAFKMAGVQNLVMSLWKIGDKETAEFMQLFYQNLFSKQSVNDAFYNTQTSLKNRYRNEPYKWAAWILVR